MAKLRDFIFDLEYAVTKIPTDGSKKFQKG
jgi:hypothetical protein